MTNNSELHVQGCLASPGRSCYILHLYANISLGMVDESLEQRKERNKKTGDQIYEFLRSHLTAQSFTQLERRFAGRLPGEA
jgi:hypothetical protein